MRFVSGLGLVSREERRRADLFFESLAGIRTRRRPVRWPEEEDHEQDAPPAQGPYLPPGGRNFVPQNGVFTFRCGSNPFTVVPASFLPERTTDARAAIDAALTASGLNAAQSAQIGRAGLVPIATEFGLPALRELFARLRWRTQDIVNFSRTPGMLAARLLVHVPGHFRELARRAPDAREAFVLECIGWLLMSHLRGPVAAALKQTLWVPPPPAWVTAVPNPVPPVTRDVSRLLLRYLLLDTTMTADQWNQRLVAWGTGLAGRQWQAEVAAPQPGRPFYASLTTIPAHVNTDARRAAFRTAWDARVDDTRRRHTPHADGATVVTLDGLLNAVALRQCEDNNPHLPAGSYATLDLQGLELAYGFPRATRTITRLALLPQLHPVYSALFKAIRELGWNDLLYESEGGACFRGTKKGAAAAVTINGKQVTVDPFNGPDATTVTRINSLFNAAQRNKVLAACRSARTMSDHAMGAAIDFNVPENGQNVAGRQLGSMDPRIVAIFEAFHFEFGACFDQSDPMHFGYCERPCAPAAANAGTLGPVVTTRMLLPLRATDRVLT